jgi:hypothetical protein
VLQAAINEFQKGSELKTGIPPGKQMAHSFFSGKDGCHTEWSNPVLVSTPSAPADPIGTETYTIWYLTSCMHEAYVRHEKVHLDSCKTLSPTLFLKDRIEEEINAYGAQRKYLEEQRQQFLCACAYYSVRLEMERPLGGAWGTARLFDSASPPRPYVDISLHPNRPGGLTGDGEGAIKANLEPQSGSLHVTGKSNQPLKFQISADSSVTSRVHTTIRMVVHDGTLETTATGGPVTVDADTKVAGPESTSTVNVTGGVPGRPGTQVLHKSAPIPYASPVVDFPGLLKTECPIDEVAGITCHATLAVAEEYSEAKAVNARGSTVREALRAIASDKNTVIAACPVTK